MSKKLPPAFEKHGRKFYPTRAEVFLTQAEVLSTTGEGFSDTGGNVSNTGEDPIEGAKRETAEETGYEVTSIKFLTTILCTPGYCEERIHIYFAELFETAHEQDQDPDENVYPVILSGAEIEDGIRSGTIFDAKTLAAWVCYKLNYDKNHAIPRIGMTF